MWQVVRADTRLFQKPVREAPDTCRGLEPGEHGGSLASPTPLLQRGGRGASHPLSQPQPQPAEASVSQTRRDLLFFQTEIARGHGMSRPSQHNGICFRTFHGGGRHTTCHPERGLQLNGFQPLSSAPEASVQLVLVVRCCCFLSSKYQIICSNCDLFPLVCDKSIIPGEGGGDRGSERLPS